MKNRSNQSILLAALICAAFPVFAGDAAKKAVVPVEPPEDIWVHPITGPYWHEDSFVTSDLRPVFAYHHFPTEVFGGGRALVYAAQLRVKLLDRLQLVAYKDGYMDIQLKGYNEPGWNDIAAGLKYQFLANDDIKLYAAAGAAYEFASGDDEVLQDDDEVRMWARSTRASASSTSARRSTISSAPTTATIRSRTRTTSAGTSTPTTRSANGSARSSR